MATRALRPAVERVALGAAWLDELWPGWVYQIDLRHLDVGSCLDCVLGQLFGDYNDAPESATSVAASHGFDRMDVATVNNESYAALTAAWHNLIVARRDARSRRGCDR